MNKPVRRNVDGVLLLDKPLHMSSNAALQKVKYLFQAKKAGHTGSLDPLATGMLPICFGEATKFSQFLLDADKTYRVSMQFGIKTTTADAEGDILEQRAVNFSLAQLHQQIAAFTGPIQQIPSMYSALKRDGQPLYKLARQGIEVERKARAITIYQLNLLEFHGDTASMEVHCSKGTYIRNLVEDIGEALGCGAHVTQLHRLSAGNYHCQAMISLSQLQAIAEQNDVSALDQFLLPANSCLQACPNVELTESNAFYLQRGQAVLIPHAPSSGLVQLTLKEGHFLGVGVVLSDGRIAPKRLLSQA